jgi:hypothetical protein
MLNRSADPRTDDTLVYQLLETDAAGATRVIGTATFRGGRTSVDCEGDAGTAVRELLERAFVDRLQPDERPRGYRRTGRATVGMLVPGMAEHIVARMRGLWLSYPDGSVVTAREALPATQPAGPLRAEAESPSPVSDPAIRRATLAETNRILNVRPLVHANPPAPGVRIDEPMHRTDCGWIV